MKHSRLSLISSLALFCAVLNSRMSYVDFQAAEDSSPVPPMDGFTIFILVAFVSLPFILLPCIIIVVLCCFKLEATLASRGSTKKPKPTISRKPTNETTGQGTETATQTTTTRASSTTGTTTTTSATKSKIMPQGRASTMKAGGPARSTLKQPSKGEPTTTPTTPTPLEEPKADETSPHTPIVQENKPTPVSKLAPTAGVTARPGKLKQKGSASKKFKTPQPGTK